MVLAYACTRLKPGENETKLYGLTSRYLSPTYLR
jgi:hypothetical protein